jgi:hypothetical protein
MASTPSVQFNPVVTTSPQNTFLVDTQGYMAGLCLDDPISRMWLRSGPVSSSNTQPLWGGLPVELEVPALNTSHVGLNVLLATTNATITGFTVFDQAYNGVTAPGSTAPQFGAGMSIAFYDLGSRARLAVTRLVSAGISRRGREHHPAGLVELHHKRSSTSTTPRPEP